MTTAPVSEAAKALGAQVGRLVEVDRPDELAAVLEEATRRSPGDPDVQMVAALVAPAADAGRRYAGRAAELAAQDGYRLLRAIHRLLDFEDVDGARRWIRTASDLADDDTAGLFTSAVGRVAAAAGDDERAEQAFRAAVEAEPGDPECVRHLVGFLLDRGRATEALEAVAAAEEARPGDPMLLRLRSDALRAFEGGAARLRQALRDLRDGTATPHDVRAALQATEVLVRLDREPEAGAHVELIGERHEDGTMTVPIYSSAELLEVDAGADGPRLEVPFLDLVASWPPNADMVIDPGSAWSLRLPAQTLVPPA